MREESILAFWSGAVPRLVRLSLSGGIVFTMYVCPFWLSIIISLTNHRYEKSMELMDRFDPERRIL